MLVYLKNLENINVIHYALIVDFGGYTEYILKNLVLLNFLLILIF